MKYFWECDKTYKTFVKADIVCTVERGRHMYVSHHPNVNCTVIVKHSIIHPTVPITYLQLSVQVEVQDNTFISIINMSNYQGETLKCYWCVFFL